MGPHARVLDVEVRISIETYDTHLHLAGLLKRMGARTVSIEREESEGEDAAREEEGDASGVGAA